MSIKEQLPWYDCQETKTSKQLLIVMLFETIFLLSDDIYSGPNRARRQMINNGSVVEVN